MEIKKLLHEIGSMQREEKPILGVFVLTTFAWITRSFILQPLIYAIDDPFIAICAGILLFKIPTRTKKTRQINWDDAVKIPWGIILLFGGGVALASKFESTGFNVCRGSQMWLLLGLSLVLLILITIAW